MKLAENKLSVLVPCLNEEGNITLLVERISAALKGCLQFEIILVDDGSIDRTASLIDQAVESFPGTVRGIHHHKNLGIESAWKSGLQIATGNLICFIDADLQNGPEDITALVKLLNSSEADIAQGVRKPTIGIDPYRYFYSRSLNVLLNYCFGMSLQDNKSCFLVARREVPYAALNHRCHYYYYQSLFVCVAHTLGYTIVQMDTKFHPRNSGTSFMSQFPLKVIFGCLRDIVIGVYEFRIQRWWRRRLGASKRTD